MNSRIEISIKEKFLKLACKTESSRESYEERIKKFCEVFNVSLEEIVEKWDRIKYDYIERQK